MPAATLGVFVSDDEGATLGEPDRATFPTVMVVDLVYHESTNVHRGDLRPQRLAAAGGLSHPVPPSLP